MVVAGTALAALFGQRLISEASQHKENNGTAHLRSLLGVPLQQHQLQCSNDERASTQCILHFVLRQRIM
jgi:hypothetical protein